MASAPPRPPIARPAATNGPAPRDVAPVITFTCRTCKARIAGDEGHLVDPNTRHHYHGDCAVGTFATGERLRTLSGALVELLAEEHHNFGRWKPIGMQSVRQNEEWARLLPTPMRATPARPAPPAPPAPLATTNGKRGAPGAALVPITQPGQRTLAQLELVIGANLASFIHCGRALAEVRERYLYLEQMFQSFGDYCEARWGFTGRHGGRLIDAHDVVGLVTGDASYTENGPAGQTAVYPLRAGMRSASMASNAPVLNEAQARELSPLLDRPDELRAAWREALDTARRDKVRLTAEFIRSVVVRRRTSPHDQRQARIREQSADRSEWYTRQNLPFGRIVIEDAARFQAGLPTGCVDVIVESSGYWQKGPYGGGPDEIGMEKTPKAFVTHLLEKLQDTPRVLADNGWLFLVLGDTYCRQPGGYRGDPDRARTIGRKAREWTSLAPTKREYDAPEGSLAMIPWIVSTAIVYELGLTCRNVICWRKRKHKPANVKVRWTESWEPVFAFTKSDNPYFNRVPGETDSWAFDDNEVWEIPVGRPGVKTDHPAVFPDELVERIFERTAPPGGIVADFFAGSGTVLDVASRMKLKALSCDLVDWQAAGRQAPGSLPVDTDGETVPTGAGGAFAEVAGD